MLGKSGVKKILLTVVVLVFVVAGWMFLRNRGEVVVSPSPVISKNLVTYTDEGYSPNTITIKKGETVTWKNKSSMTMWTASGVHPVHTAYTGTNIANCGTPASLNQFDACIGVAPGQSWSFKFDLRGTWGYHNHTNASHWGKIVVE